jgi:hypothetical protein
MANGTLRAARHEAHLAFDALWKSAHMSRTHAYHWLAEKMGIAIAACHIGKFNLKQCDEVVEIMRDYR